MSCNIESIRFENTYAPQGMLISYVWFGKAISDFRIIQYFNGLKPRFIISFWILRGISLNVVLEIVDIL